MQPLDVQDRGRISQEIPSRIWRDFPVNFFARSLRFPLFHSQSPFSVRSTPALLIFSSSPVAYLVSPLDPRDTHYFTLSSRLFVRVRHKTLNLVNSRCCFVEDGREMYLKLKRMCSAEQLFCDVVVAIGSLIRKVPSLKTETFRCIYLAGHQSDESFSGQDMKGYRMVPFNLKVLAKFGLCSNCSQRFHGSVLDCSCSQNIFNCSYARVLVNIYSIARNFVYPAL